MKRLLIGFCIVIFSLPALKAQELTLNPYSRYALGDILSATTTRNAAMGGVGVATDNYFSINPINPATYADMLFTTMDFTTFGHFVQLRTDDQTENQVTAGFQNLAFAFPSTNKFVLTMGFTPYSAVGYEVQTLSPVKVEDTTVIERTIYSAKGGLNQAFIGGATRLLKQRLRIGANLKYAFGNTQYLWNSQLLTPDSNQVIPAFNPVSVTEDAFIRGFSGQIGIIYEDTINRAKNRLFRIGATTEYALNMGGDRFTTFSTGFIDDTLRTQETGDVVVPPSFALGILINQPGEWSIAADFTYQDWSQFTYFSDDIILGRQVKISGGAEWIPNIESPKYLNRMDYRIGGYWRQSYITFDGVAVNDYGVTVGIGLPAGLKGNSRFNRGRSVSRVNISGEFGRQGSLASGLPLESLYARVRLGVTLNDRWFIRRVVD
ncbi:MAG: hypothetical protein AAFR61_15820 [Bacteroidota bacterium]